MRVTRTRNVIAILVAVAVAATTPAAVFAATASKTTTPQTTDTQNLRVSPVRSELSVNKGSSGMVKTFVTNLTSAPITVRPIENDFIAGDESGTPAIILNENSYAPTHSLKRFMVPLSNVTIAPKATQEVDVTIRVPANAHAGGYFGAIRFAPVTPGGNVQLNFSGSVASLILMTVPGEFKEALQLTNFDVQQNGGKGSNFRTPNDLSLLVRFKNTGDVQEQPFGQIYVQKGKKVLYKSNFNTTNPKDNVLPDSARRWNVPLKGFGKFGKYTVGATFSYGTQGTSIDIQKTVWIIPTTYIVAFIVTLIVIILLIFGIWKFLKGYKKRILKNARGGNHRGGGSFGAPGGGYGPGPRQGGNGQGGQHGMHHDNGNHPQQPHRTQQPQVPSYGAPAPQPPRPANPPRNGSYPPRREGGSNTDGYNGPRRQF